MQSGTRHWVKVLLASHTTTQQKGESKQEKYLTNEMETGGDRDKGMEELERLSTGQEGGLGGGRLTSERWGGNNWREESH